MTRSALKDFRDAARRTRAELRGDKVIFNDRTYTEGAVSVTPSQIDNGEGGFVNVNILTWRIGKAVLPARPADKAVIRYDGKDWIITGVGGRESWKSDWTVTAAQ